MSTTRRLIWTTWSRTGSSGATIIVGSVGGDGSAINCEARLTQEKCGRVTTTTQYRPHGPRRDTAFASSSRQRQDRTRKGEDRQRDRPGRFGQPWAGDGRSEGETSRSRLQREKKGSQATFSTLLPRSSLMPFLHEVVNPNFLRLPMPPGAVRTSGHAPEQGQEAMPVYHDVRLNSRSPRLGVSAVQPCPVVPNVISVRGGLWGDCSFWFGRPAIPARPAGRWCVLRRRW